MMICSLLLFISSLLYYIRNKYVYEKNEKLQKKIVYVFFTAILFLGSKFQVVTALPFLIFIIVKICLDNRKIISKKYRNIYIILFCFMIIMPIRFSQVNAEFCSETKYNSVFYGILNGSEDPEKDLIDLGLDTDLASEAGKHAYLDENEYKKYIPGAEITQRKFYDEISNGKLVIFYITHPNRLLRGMEYTATKAFRTSTSLGKCYREDNIEPVSERYNRFTIWSKFREKYLPTKLWFIISVYFCIFSVSLIKYIKNNNNLEQKNRIIVLWIVMLIGVIQYPMPFIGNGQADTSKQLFLFNFIFDILIVVSIGCTCCKITSLISNWMKRIRSK